MVQSFYLFPFFLYHYLFFKCLQSSIPLTRSKEKKNIKLEKLEFSLPFIIPFNLDKLTNICYNRSFIKSENITTLCFMRYLKFFFIWKKNFTTFNFDQAQRVGTIISFLAFNLAREFPPFPSLSIYRVKHFRRNRITFHISNANRSF